MVGFIDGDEVGERDGELGLIVLGFKLGKEVEGLREGTNVGTFEGKSVGFSVGLSVGYIVETFSINSNDMSLP